MADTCPRINFTLKNRFFQHQYQKHEKIIAFSSWLVSHYVCIYIKYFFGLVRNKLWTTGSETLNTKYLELIKRRSKVEENNMSCERGLNFDQWKTFFENYKPIKFDYGLFTNLPRIVNFSPISFKLKRGILPFLRKYIS